MGYSREAERIYIMRNEFENVLINGIHVSRYIASWTKASRHAGRPVYFDDLFMQWLKEEAGLSDDEVRTIHNFAINGKLELETNAERFIKAHK
jgi:hypothetical protein